MNEEKLSSNLAENEQQKEISIPGLIAMGLSTRVLVDTSTQLFHSFLPIIAAGLGTDIISLGRLVSLRSLMGITAPLFGDLADRMGYRFTMRISLVMGAIGLFLVGASSNFWMAGAGMLLMGMGLYAFIPVMQAYLSARLPYHSRARGLAMVEYAWALAGIIGLFAMGLLIEWISWRAPFFVLGAGLFLASLLFIILPPALPGSSGQAAPLPLVGARSALRQLRDLLDLGSDARSAWGAILFTSLALFAAVHVLIAHGEWLNQEYQLGAVELGQAAILFGLADLGGSMLVSLVADRFGRRRTVMAGTIGAVMSYLLLPFLNVSVTAAIASIVILRFCFEISVVGNLSLLSEQIPSQRGKVMTLAAALGTCGVSLAGFTGPYAYTKYGVWGLGLVSAAAMALALLILLTRVREA